MAKAAEDTYFWTKWAAIVASFGTVFLVWNLFEARRSNKVALDAVETAVESNKIARKAGEIETASYLAIQGGEFEITGRYFQGHVFVKNFGMSPAEEIELKMRLSVVQNWNGGKLMPAYEQGETVKPYISRLYTCQPASEGKFWFYWNADDIGQINMEHMVATTRFHVVIDCMLSWHTVFEGPKSMSLRAQVSTVPGFVQDLDMNPNWGGQLYVRNYNRSECRA